MPESRGLPRPAALFTGDELADRSLDLYIWLAYRLHTLKQVTPVRWAALSDQFGGTYSRQRDFVRDLRKALVPAVSAYPEAKVEIEDDGLLLHPSRPPVAPRLVALSGR